MDEDHDVLTVSISGDWYANDMAELVTTIDEHYSDLVLLYMMLDLQSRKESSSVDESIPINVMLTQIEDVLFGEQEHSRYLISETDWLKPFQLKVLRISYGSDGGWDFLGMGKAIKEAFRLLQGILTFVGDRELRREKCLENAERAIALARAAGASPEAIGKMTQKTMRRCGFLFELKDQSKIKALPHPNEGTQPS